MKTRFWSSDWFAGLVITIVIVVLSGSAPFQSLERDLYDWGVRSSDRLPSDKIAVIAIDDASINNLGRWPWPRDMHAELISKLQQGGAKVVGQRNIWVICFRVNDKDRVVLVRIGFYFENLVVFACIRLH